VVPASGDGDMPRPDPTGGPAHQVGHPEAEQTQSNKDHQYRLSSSLSWAARIAKAPLRARLWEIAPWVAPSSAAIRACGHFLISP
jgi:hypothetical protein